MLYALRQLYAANIFSPSGLYKLAGSFCRSGLTPLALLQFSAAQHADRVAVIDDQGAITYRDLHLQTRRLLAVLREQYNLEAGQKIAVLCRNHIPFVKALFAVSASGADIYLLNTDMSNAQFSALQAKYNFDLLILDPDLSHLLEGSGYKGRTIYSYHLTRNAIERLSRSAQYYPERYNLMQRAGNIVILSGGTTGTPKTVRRRPALRSYLNPFCTLVGEADLARLKSVYIGTPMHHGYGLAAVITALLLGSKVLLTEHFDAANACKLVKDHGIEVATLVPLMLSRMLACDPDALTGLECIISGGAALSPSVVVRSQKLLGRKLFNLYGTSESGFSILAKPADLNDAPNTIGRQIRGVQLMVLDEAGKELPTGRTGRICIKSRWSVGQKNGGWVDTGDMGYCDIQGRYFLCGRTDDMIVSGGENVYPFPVEHMLLSHGDVADAAVIGVDDSEFGQRLKGFVVTRSGKTTEDDLLHWLRTRVARYEVPVAIEILTEMPYTALGKPDKKQLVAATG